MIENTSAMDRPIDQRSALIRRLLVGGLLLAALAVAGVWLLPRAASWLSAERSVDASRVRFGTVSRGDLERDLSVQGRIVAAFHPTTFSPEAGIVSLRVRPGEVVEAGQVLAVLESPELRNRLEQEQSTLASREAELERQRIQAKQGKLADQQAIDLAVLALESARRAMGRAEQSRREGIINDVEFETAEDELRRSELQLAHARQDAALERETLDFETRNREMQVHGQRLAVAELRRQVDELVVRAPVPGLVSRIDVEDRDAVESGRALVTVVDLSAFEVEVLIPESYADEVGPGTPAMVRVGVEEFPAELRSVSPEVESGQVRGVVAFADRAADGLRQNQRVATRLILESRSDVLKVPRGPFLDSGGGRRAFLVDGDSAVLQEIRVGASSVAEVEIVSGLQEGDRIIISDTARYGDARRLFLRQ